MDYGKLHEQLADIFYRQVKGKFDGISSSGGVDIGIVLEGKKISWEYKETECQGEFADNGKYPVTFFFTIKFLNERGLIEIVDNSFSGNEVERTDYLGRPSRLSQEVEGDSVIYSVKCPISRIPRTKNQKEAVAENLWRNFAGQIVGKATKII